MAFWNKGEKEDGVNLSLMQETKESPKATQETPKVGAERVSSWRKGLGERISGAFKKTAEIGGKLVSGFDRVAGKGLEGYDSAKAGVSRGAEAFTGGMDKIYNVDVPAWATEKAVGVATAAGETIGQVAKWGKEGLKTGAELGVGAAVVGYEGTKNTLSKAGDKGWEATQQVADWTAEGFGDSKQWVGAKYESLKGWAGERADGLRERGHQNHEKLKAGIERVSNWRKDTIAGFREKGAEALRNMAAKLSPEIQTQAAVIVAQVEGGERLKNELVAA